MSLEVDVDGRTAKVDETVKLVVLAADGLSIAVKGNNQRPFPVGHRGQGLPGVAARTTDGDGAAVKANLASAGASCNAEKA